MNPRHIEVPFAQLHSIMNEHIDLKLGCARGFEAHNWINIAASNGFVLPGLACHLDYAATLDMYS